MYFNRKCFHQYVVSAAEWFWKHPLKQLPTDDATYWWHFKVLTCTPDTSILRMYAVVDVQATVGAVGKVELQPGTPHIIQHYGPIALPKVGITQSQSTCALEPQLTTHDLQKENKVHHLVVQLWFCFLFYCVGNRLRGGASTPMAAYVLVLLILINLSPQWDVFLQTTFLVHT